MAAIGRNAPCPCGSGNKYKKCCLANDERDAAQKRISAAAAAGASWVLEDDGLDDLSNSVLALIKARRFDEALAACRRLLDEFPDVVDGMERSALVYAAMGDHEKAAAFYRDALAFITHPSRRDDYEGAEYFQQQLALQERLATRAAGDHAQGAEGGRAP
ncbi:MAG: SEC-C domain-containing protein [Myxococcales bacterium]|nr:SEC-C domain-containing protein [Myxococcales bacterium]